MSSANEWCNVDTKNNGYISPIEIWIEEACNSPSEPWNSFDFLQHDEDSNADLIQAMKEVPMYIFYKFDVSLFFLATKHKGNIQGNVFFYENG